MGQHPTNISYQPPAGHPPNLNDKGRDSKVYFENDNGETPVRHWPKKSEHVAKITPLRAFIIFFDALLASTPIMFIALAIIAARLDGRPVTTYGRNLERTLLLSPTIFPIIFAALMGRCFKHFGLFLAERGTTLGRLEQLIGCQSLFSAIERQIALRSWSIIGLLLTLVWLLSPLGGQSALRILDVETKAETSTGMYQYLNPMASQDSFLMGASATNSGRSTFTSLFLAALMSSTRYQNTPMDLWGNVKMPLYSSITNSTTNNMVNVVNIGPSLNTTIGATTNITYASLIGVPVANVRTSGWSHYNLRARQWDLTCNSNKELSTNATDFGNFTATWKMNYTDNNRCDNYPCSISFKSMDEAGNFSVAACQASYDYYEMQVTCNGTACQADAMQKLDLLSDGYTQDNDDFTRSNLLRIMMNTLPTVDNYGVGDLAARGSTYMERWMVDPWNFIGAKYDYVDLYKLPPSILAERLTILFNSFFQSTYATTALGGNLPSNLTSLSDNDFYLTFNATQASITDVSHLVYKTKWRWFTALLVSSIILQIAAYAGVILKYTTLAPDIIGYASSLTLLNPYTPTPTGGTTLHGLERTALLHDLPVRIGDVCKDEPVGAIAMARSDLGRVGSLDRRRFYI